MEQTAPGLFVIGWKLALAFIAGSSALTTLGVFLLARFTHLFDAYAGERAKLLAQFHNLDKLVEQTKALTATTEAIKARTSDEVWDRQMRWTYKRDLYIKIIEKMAELISAESHFQLYEAAHKNSQVPLQHLKDTMFDLILLTEVGPHRTIRACGQDSVESQEAHRRRAISTRAPQFAESSSRTSSTRGAKGTGVRWFRRAECRNLRRFKEPEHPNLILLIRVPDTNPVQESPVIRRIDCRLCVRQSRRCRSETSSPTIRERFHSTDASAAPWTSPVNHEFMLWREAER